MKPLAEWMKQVEERLEKATPGPWEPCGARFSIVTSYLNPQENLDICDTAIADMMTNQQATHNTYLIANAPADLATALKVIKKLIEQRDALFDFLEAIEVEVEDDGEHLLNAIVSGKGEG